MTSNLPQLYANMSLPELVAYMRGHILIELGKGCYEQAVYDAVATAWARGAEAAPSRSAPGDIRGA